MTSMTSAASDPARGAAVATMLHQVDEGMVLGLGSGRAVWALVDALTDRFGSMRVVGASSATDDRLRAAGFEVVELDGDTQLDIAIDGADEVGPQLGLIKGHGAALLREKLVVSAARRFVVLAEEPKLVERLGQRRRLPVEVVRFAWPETARRVSGLLSDPTLRRDDDGEPVVTDEGHLLLDGVIPEDVDPAALAADLKGTLGVVEHGLFIGMADEAIIGRPDGTVDVRRR